MPRRLHYDSAEQALLGAVILEGDGAYDAAAVEPGDFFNLRHQKIWGAMRDLRELGQPAGDVQLLESALAEDLDPVGGLAYLASLTAATVPSHVSEYSRLVRKAALTRRVQLALSELTSSDLEGSELLAEVLDRVRRLTVDLDDPARTMAEAAVETRDELTEAVARKEAGEGCWGLSTGYADVDDLLGGLQRGVVTILAGRPSMGKSALARSFAANVVAAGYGAHVFSLEDSRRSYTLRQLSDTGSVPLKRFQTLDLKYGDVESVGRAVSMLRERRRWLIDDTAALGASEIALRVRKHKPEVDTALVVVDYGQLIREPDIPPNELRVQLEVATKRLVELARTEDICVLLLSQLSRACETRPNKRPILSDLRESGNLEQDAYAVMFLYLDEKYNEESEDRGVAELLLRKNKNGSTGTVKLAFDADTATFKTFSPRSEPTQGSWA
jgi:replicative DNA helicase